MNSGFSNVAITLFAATHCPGSRAEEIRGTQVPPDHLGICWLGQAGFLLKAPDGTSMVLDPYQMHLGAALRVTDVR